MSDIATLAIDAGTTVEALGAAELSAGKSVAASITSAIATIGENMNLRRAAQISVSEGVIASYMHNSTAPGLGKIGVLVGIQ